LYERHGVVSDLLEKCDQHLDAIVEIIGDYECIPGDMVLAPCRTLLKSISSNVQYVTLAKIFLTSKFSYSLFSNPTHKTKTETTNRLETTNRKPLGPIIMVDPSENREQQSNHIYYILL
jgi:hypothetical protein